MFEHWEAAEATVVATRRLSNWSRQGLQGAECPYDYIVDVRPEGQPVFRATFHDALMHGYVQHPAEGDVVNDSGMTGFAFTRESVNKFGTSEPMQAAGAAALYLAWGRRRALKL